MTREALKPEESPRGGGSLGRGGIRQLEHVVLDASANTPAQEKKKAKILEGKGGGEATAPGGRKVCYTLKKKKKVKGRLHITGFYFTRKRILTKRSSLVRKKVSGDREEINF